MHPERNLFISNLTDGGEMAVLIELYLDISFGYHQTFVMELRDSPFPVRQRLHWLCTAWQTGVLDTFYRAWLYTYDVPPAVNVTIDYRDGFEVANAFKAFLLNATLLDCKVFLAKLATASFATQNKFTITCELFLTC